jgi:hypothetical protein
MIDMDRNNQERNRMQKNKIERSKDGKGKTMYVPLSVYRSGKTGLTISCSDTEHAFKFGTTPEELQKFRSKVQELFSEIVERPRR